MAWPNFCTRISIVVLPFLMMCRCMMDQEIDDTIQMINMCQFIVDNLAPEGTTQNVAVIECGKEIEDAQAQRVERAISGAGPSNDNNTQWRKMKKVFLRMVNEHKFLKKELAKYRDFLYSCVSKLEQESERRPDKRLIMLIDPRDLSQFDNLLKNGRPFIKRITFEANYEIHEDFFIHLIESMLNPFTSANTIVQDIGIGTPTLGIWDRDILVETLNEKYFDEMTYNTGDKPHWEVLYKMDDKIKVKMHFCQLSQGQGRGQKFRMWRFKKEEDTTYYMNKIIAFVNQDYPAKEICF